MADFPSLKPSERRFRLGIYPVTTERGFGGGNIRFLHGPQSSSHELELQFLWLSQSEAELIREHYRGQQGGTLAFDLSAAVLTGNTYYSSMVATVAWRYSEPPEEEQLSGGLVNVAVRLESVI
jgi:hypothetical protein